MSKTKLKVAINLDLLKPQSNPEKLLVKIFRWLLSSGRFIFILVEAIVLIAFFTRFKLDYDLNARKETIEEQIPYIETLKPDEILIKQTQLKLATINAFKTNEPDYPQILQQIGNNTPLSVTITSLNLEKTSNKVTVRISAQAQNNNGVITFITKLKEDKHFSNATLSSAGLEEAFIKFTIEATYNIAPGGKNL
ncbi:hypothetical protein A3H81_04135 [Candidatus Daviesbacteria bacterium RIFCSPLOWO2_02_FULL_38_18]|nr:MAG: hypothetical protein A3D02_04625 [Candidatus Daviesbacteria bacterium RIFCSPHIGHO2_02_FULL_39_41]OGE45661.1 MAG: hypothetical protein A3E67_02725 [Candidatus Daviesbacteria bacterium RIFCSPHIGHO2_12_FULL_38_25]OGE67183.1 MAG: hypothetical protein A3H81_04135 [Candidatus Daviesbacteria bacterium RIFCSPLOWO2_02_FULL_38_18]OGE73520.1 MAG: hypothetical protein A3H18_02870 [Candidatus Daviesbacteria bacterium RIFCSPLOWO2_12_FULL_38_10]